ncbi:hypothetical protein BJ122_13516 [Rhodopseudomonas faecalis]|uniref:Uncharacterized protein n=1 Tax=Rhodopseudomonas faecalis TaxID=99655 RepID=A0A318TMQ7_9BRAD|nr:hypothetical protein BJ122_13516 [Rhodopseudomonas faecalis]
MWRVRLINRESCAVKATEIEGLANASAPASDLARDPLSSRSTSRVWARHRLQQLALAGKLGVRADPVALGASTADRQEA